MATMMKAAVFVETRTASRWWTSPFPMWGPTTR